MPRIQFQDRGGFHLLEPGDYTALVTEAREGTTERGNAKLELKLDVNGSVVFDSLVFTETAGWRIDTFLKACGLAPAKGEFVEMTTRLCEHAVGRVRIGMRPGLKDPSKIYNCVEAWLCDRKSLELAEAAREDSPF